MEFIKASERACEQRRAHFYAQRFMKIFCFLAKFQSYRAARFFFFYNGVPSLFFLHISIVFYRTEVHARVLPSDFFKDFFLNLRRICSCETKGKFHFL